MRLEDEQVNSNKRLHATVSHCINGTTLAKVKQALMETILIGVFW